jgi:hypothetical protein
VCSDLDSEESPTKQIYIQRTTSGVWGKGETSSSLFQKLLKTNWFLKWLLNISCILSVEFVEQLGKLENLYLGRLRLNTALYWTFLDAFKTTFGKKQTRGHSLI